MEQRRVLFGLTVLASIVFLLTDQSLAQTPKRGGTLRVSYGNEVANLDLTRSMLTRLGLGDEMIRWVEDRAGHDRRYSIDCSKVRALGWEPRVDYEKGLAATVDWYRDNRWWWEKIKHGTEEFARWRARWYEERR